MEYLGRSSFLASLATKQASVLGSAYEAGFDSSALFAETERQIRQVSRSRHGDPITGHGVTKSGYED